MMQIRFTYATNEDKVYFIDMGIRKAKCEYVIPSTEQELSTPMFPSPQELWLMTYPEANHWQDIFNFCPFQSRKWPQFSLLSTTCSLRTRATSRGKTAFQTCCKLYHTRLYNQEDLQTQWSHPNTRQALLDQLEQEGFSEDKLEMIRTVLRYEKSDLLDVMEYLAYNTTPLEREHRVQLVKQQIASTHTKEQQVFVNFILDYYQREGFKELASDNLKKFINLKYHSIQDGLRTLGMNGKQVRDLYLDMQRMLFVTNGHASHSASNRASNRASDAAVKPYDVNLTSSSMGMVADDSGIEYGKGKN